jgi:hypothetical protein
VFFGTVYKALLRNILLGIGRLTDPLSTLGKDNLVLERLCLLPEVSGDSTLSSEIKTRLNQIKSAASGVREYRNKYLAHLDLPTALGASPEVLPGVKRQDVDKILDGFADLFNLIEQKLRGSHTAFELMAIHDGPDALLTRLEDAEAFRTLPFQERQHLRTEWKKKQ